MSCADAKIEHAKTSKEMDYKQGKESKNSIETEEKIENAM